MPIEVFTIQKAEQRVTYDVPTYRELMQTLACRRLGELYNQPPHTWSASLEEMGNELSFLVDVVNRHYYKCLPPPVCQKIAPRIFETLGSFRPDRMPTIVPNQPWRVNWRLWTIAQSLMQAAQAGHTVVFGHSQMTELYHPWKEDEWYDNPEIWRPYPPPGMEDVDPDQ